MVAVQELASRSDEDLALEARGGDHLAFGELYRRYYGVIASYVRPKIGDGTEDVIQNVFVSIRAVGSRKGNAASPTGSETGSSPGCSCITS